METKIENESLKLELELAKNGQAIKLQKFAGNYWLTFLSPSGDVHRVKISKTDYQMVGALFTQGLAMFVKL